ncbi:MAG TPA: ABC transporter substrate-binding protein [Pyrinomonadaceae bacterium]|nr:ABC transporter substrate-binding protein [Pyrinomonadaceae bacterium]
MQRTEGDARDSSNFGGRAARITARRLFSCLLLVAASLFFFSPAASTQTQTTPPQRPATNAPASPSPSPPARDAVQSFILSPQERRGKAIYLRGEGADGREFTAVMGEIDVPASTLTCAGCHGVKGEGKTEGGVTAGNLTWQHLIKSYGHTHPSGRKHGPFDEASFARAVLHGTDPDGNALLVAMPRYKLSPQDLADLVAYLKRVETDRDPGLTETSLRVGTLLPLAGPLAESGQAMRDAMAAYFEEVNARGGIYSRKIELRSAQGGTDAATTAAALKRLLTDEAVFALVGGMTAGADAEVASLVAAEEVPFVGPATLLPHASAPPNRQVFYVLPGVREQARALVNFAAARPGLKQANAAVLYSPGEINLAAASGIEEQAKRAGWGSVVKTTFEPGKSDAAQAVAALKAQNVGALFVAAPGAEKALLQEAERAGWTPHVFLVGVLAGRDFTPDSVTAAFKDKIFLGFPSVPADVTPAALAEFRALSAKYKLPARHVASQLSAYAAAKIFVEGLQRAGRDLSREKLITALEGLYQFETGVTPRVTFGPNRRVGANGAHIVLIDTDKKQYVSAGQWVAAD